MKHPTRITAIIILFFIITQITGLLLLSQTINIKKEAGTITINHDETAIGERPAVSGIGSIIYLLTGVILGTIILLLIIKFKKPKVWKTWFLIAVWMAITVTTGVITKTVGEMIKNQWLREWLINNSTTAMIIAGIITYYKIRSKRPIIHNITEIMVYTGLAIILAPLFTPRTATILLLIISAYDAYAVWKSKHMITLAKFQANNGLFAGIMIPKEDHKEKRRKTANQQLSTNQELRKELRKELRRSESKRPELRRPGIKGSKLASNEKETLQKRTGKAKKRYAILGGGDLVFPLIYSGTILEWLIRTGYDKITALELTTITVITSAAALTTLFIISKKERFYPAMPFITTGALIGGFIIKLIIG